MKETRKAITAMIAMGAMLLGAYLASLSFALGMAGHSHITTGQNGQLMKVSVDRLHFDRLAPGVESTMVSNDPLGAFCNDSDAHYGPASYFLGDANDYSIDTVLSRDGTASVSYAAAGRTMQLDNLPRWQIMKVLPKRIASRVALSLRHCEEVWARAQKQVANKKVLWPHP